MCSEPGTTIGRYSARAADAARITPKDVGAESWDDVAAIKAWQAAHGLTADGMFGRQSVYAFYRAREGAFRAALAAAHVKIDDQRLRASTTFPREAPAIPSSVIWHDTIDRAASQTLRTLEHVDPPKKPTPYATGFIIDEDGTIYQCADVLTRWGIHAGAINQESVGVDVVNVLDPSYLDHSAGDLVRRQRIVPRSWSASKVHGQAIDYTPAQKVALVTLARALSAWLRIPATIPSEFTGYGDCIETIKETSPGHFAHGQWSTKRWDGLLAAELLAAAGFAAWKAA